MGLDQTLSANYFISNDDTIAGVMSAIELPSRGGFIDPANAPPNYLAVTAPLLHWRKSNQIHAWFVDNCQDGEDDCRTAQVSREKLQELSDLINEVLDSPDKAEELMPVRSGFFFGSTDYAEDYYANLKDTFVQLNLILNEPKYHEVSFEYSSSW